MDSKRQRVMPGPVASRQMPYDDEEWADRLEIARARREKVLAMRAAQKEAEPEAAPEPMPEPAPEPIERPKPEPAERLKSALRAARPGAPARAAVAAAPVPRIRAERREAEPELWDRPEPPARRPRRRGNLYLATLLIGIAAGSAATVKVMNWLEEDIETSVPALSIDPPKVAEAAPVAAAAPVTDEPREAAAPAPVLDEAPAETEVAVVTPDPEPVAQAKPPKPTTKPAARPADAGATAPAKPAGEGTAGADKPKDDGAGETQAATTAGAAAPKPPASDSTVRIYAPRSVAAGELDAVGATLRGEGIVKQSTDRVGYNVGTSQVRYYHPGDAAEAKRIAKAVNATPRDFTDRKSVPAEGTLEVYLAGTSPGTSTARRTSEPPLAEATAAVQSFVNNLAAQMRQGMQR